MMYEFQPQHRLSKELEQLLKKKHVEHPLRPRTLPFNGVLALWAWAWHLLNWSCSFLTSDAGILESVRPQLAFFVCVATGFSCKEELGQSPQPLLRFCSVVFLFELIFCITG